MMRITELLVILIVTLSLTSASVIPKIRFRRQFNRDNCHAIEGFECTCSRYRVVCTTDQELPSSISVLEDEKHKYSSVELTIQAEADINVNEHTFDQVKELFRLDGYSLEFRIKFEKYTALHLSSPGIFNQIFPDDLPSDTRKDMALEMYNPSVRPNDNENLFQNFSADSLEVYILYPTSGTFQQVFDGANIKYLRTSGGDIRSDVLQSFTGNIARLEIAKQTDALSIENFPVYPVHEFIINAFYVSDFNHKHPPNYDNLVELRVQSSERIPANAFRQFPNLHSLSVSTDENIDPHAFDGLNRLEKLTIKDGDLHLDIFNSLPKLKELEIMLGQLNRSTQCELVNKLANEQVAVKAIPDGFECTCVSAYLDTAAERIPCDAIACEESSCDAIQNSYNADTRTFNTPSLILRSDGTNALREAKRRVYTVPYQVTSQDQEKLRQASSESLQQPTEADTQTSDIDEQKLLQFIQSYYFQNLDSSIENSSCSSGKYLYEGQCILCKPGYYCPDGESRIPCPRGKISPGYGYVACRECPEGWYSTCDTQETCLMCPQGFYCPSNDQEPQACPVGHYSRYAATECTECPSGYYTTYTNSSYCFQCPLGYSCMDPAECPQPCPAGMHQPNIMSTSCEPCPDEHQCGDTTNLLQCSATSCIQAEAWPCDPNQLSPPASVCTNMR